MFWDAEEHVRHIRARSKVHGTGMEITRWGMLVFRKEKRTELSRSSRTFGSDFR